MSNIHAGADRLRKKLTARGMKEEDAIKVLQDINSILDIQEIRYWIDAGILLGAVRDGKIIPWDTDIDLGILYRDARKLLQRISEFKRKGYAIDVTDSVIEVVKGSIVAMFMIYQPKREVYFLCIVIVRLSSYAN